MRRLTFFAVSVAMATSGCATRVPVPMHSPEMQALDQRRANGEAELARRVLSKGVPKSLQVKAEEFIKPKLLDGDSAKFINEYTSTLGGSVAVCGAINAKNVYGGYTGYKAYYVEFIDGIPANGDNAPFRSPESRAGNVCGYINSDSRFVSVPK